MIYIVIYENAEVKLMPVKLEHLPGYLRDLYTQFEGKTLIWNHGEIQEYAP